MSKLKKIVGDLEKIAKSNEDRAYRVLGARPGPGFDIMIYPMSGRWNIEGITQAGTAFIEKFWIERPLTNQKLAEMKKQANEWQLTYKTEFSVVSLGGK